MAMYIYKRCLPASRSSIASRKRKFPNQYSYNHPPVQFLASFRLPQVFHTLHKRSNTAVALKVYAKVHYTHDMTLIPPKMSFF